MKGELQYIRQQISTARRNSTARAFAATTYWKPTPWLTLIGCFSWDHASCSDDCPYPAMNAFEGDDDRVSGKFGFTATPSKAVTVRGAWSQGLGEVTYGIESSVSLVPESATSAAVITNTGR